MNINYPYNFNVLGRTSEVGSDEHIRDMIEQIIFTAPGERVNRPDFGSGILQMVFGPSSPEVATATQMLVQGALQQWLGDLIRVEAVSVVSDDSKLKVIVNYMILRNQQHQQSEFVRDNVS